MNKGIRAANGEFLLFINAGDRFLNDSVLSEIDSVISPKTRIVSADFINVKEEGDYNGRRNLQDGIIGNVSIEYG